MKFMAFAQKIRHMIGKGLKFISEILLADVPVPVLMPEQPKPEAAPVQDTPPGAPIEGIPMKSRPRNRGQYEEGFKTSPDYYRIALPTLRELLVVTNLSAKDLQDSLKVKNNGVSLTTDRTFRRVLGVLEEQKFVRSQKAGPKGVTHYFLSDKDSAPKLITEMNAIVEKLLAEATSPNQEPSHDPEFEN